MKSRRPPPARRLGALLSRKSGVDEEGGPGNQCGGWWGEEHDGAGDVAGFADATEGELAEQIGAEGIVLEPFYGARRLDERRRDRVDRDAVLAPLDRKALGQVMDGRLGHAVDRLGGEPHEARLRAEHDDFA